MPLGQKRLIDTQSRPAAKTLRGSIAAFCKTQLGKLWNHPSEYADTWEAAPYCKMCGDILASAESATHYCCADCAEAYGLVPSDDSDGSARRTADSERGSA